MITVTDSAKQELTSFFEGKDIQPIRIHLADGGCGGMRLSLALDKLRDNDVSEDHGAFTFLIQQELADATGEVTIDMTQYGFTIDSEKSVGGGGCGSCTSDCG